jgi:hypothetical protein
VKKRKEIEEEMKKKLRDGWLMRLVPWLMSYRKN